MLVAAAASGGGAFYFLGNRTGSRADLVLHRVGYETIQLTIVERGQLESADNRDVICRVKAGSKGSTVATTIKWVIDDGSPVRQGQLICELDDSGLHVRPGEAEVRAVAGDGVLRRVLEALEGEAAGPDPKARQVAERAILVLYSIAREVRP